MVKLIYNEIDPSVKVTVKVKDGKEVKKGDQCRKNNRQYKKPAHRGAHMSEFYTENERHCHENKFHCRHA